MKMISEDDVLALLTNHHFDNDKGNFDLLIHNLCKEVRCIPTAYDADKVVEQLELLKKYDLNLADMMLDIQSNGLDRHFICLEDAIEIVKAGRTDGD